MESDLDQMTRGELIAEIKKLRGGIRKHRDSSLHELCWHHPELWGLLPEKTDPIPVVPDWPEFIRGCVRYRQSLDEQAPNASRSGEPYESDTKEGLDSLLKHSKVAARLPVQDLERARLFYSEKLGLEPIEERPGGLLYRCESGSFALFISRGASAGDFTQMAFEVTDLRATVKALTACGVVFEEYDLPGLKTVEGIAEVAGNYPSKGGNGELAAWFKDSEGNLLGTGQALR